MLRLIHRSRSIHELMLDVVCRRTGLYIDAGVDVVPADGRGAAWRAVSAPPSAVTVAVGGVVAEWLRGDPDWRIHFIATVRPLMWVVGHDSITSPAQLAGRRIATPRRTDMPTMFLRLLLERHGCSLDHDVTIVEVDRRPDRERLLARGEVDASLLGPEGLVLTHTGFRPALYIGDLVEYPTVGLAARPGADPAETTALRDAFAEALARIEDDPSVGVAAMCEIDPMVTEEVASRVVRDVVVPDWRGAEWARSGLLGDVPDVAEHLGVPLHSPSVARRFLHDWVAVKGECR